MNDHQSSSDLPKVKTYSFHSGESSIHEDERLLADEHYYPKLECKSSFHHRKRDKFWTRKNLLRAVNAFVFLTGACAWAYVLVKPKVMHCKPANEFEPDRKNMTIENLASFNTDQISRKVQFTSRVTFQPHHYYGGPPSNETNEMWRRLSPRKLPFTRPCRNC